MYGFTAAGHVVRIDPATGAGTLETTCSASFSAGDAPYLGGMQLLPASGLQFWRYWPSGPACATSGPPLTGLPAGYEVRGLACPDFFTVQPAGASQWTNWAVLRAAGPGQDDLIAHINGTTHVYHVVGASGRTDLEGIELDREGRLFAIGTGDGGRLYSIDPETGAATPIGPGGLGDLRGLSFDEHGVLYGVGAQLVRIDPVSGTGEVIGPTGFAGIECLITVRSGGCYADCNGDGVLTIADWGCHQTYFAIPECGQKRDCNGDFLCTVADFGCFQTAFVLGCP